MLKAAQKCFPLTWPWAAETGGFSTWQTCLFLPCQLSNGHNVHGVNQSVFFIHKAGERIKGTMPQWVTIKVRSSPLTSHPAVTHWHRGGRRWLVAPTYMHERRHCRPPKKRCCLSGYSSEKFNLWFNKRVISIFYRRALRKRPLSKRIKSMRRAHDDRADVTSSCNSMQSLLFMSENRILGFTINIQRSLTPLAIRQWTLDDFYQRWIKIY